ncbi:MAG: hypothetical protein ACFE9Q_12335 [Candidatus Hodarchaeota archaeon]
MRFISGLKSLSKKRILLVIVILFIVSWFLFAFGVEVFPNATFKRYFLIFLGVLAGFTFVLFIMSFIIPLDKMRVIIIIISIGLTLPVMWIFGGIINIFTFFCYIANIVITAFFAYKFCMDTSIKVDDYLYEKKSSRIFTRIIEFVIFFLLSWWLTSLTIRFFVSFANPNVQNLARIFFNLFLIGLVLLGIVVIRLLFTKKFAAYISFFIVLTFFYVLYIIVDLWAEFMFPDTVGYDLLSFFIDFLLFLFIIGSIYDRVDYIKSKIKILRVDTISLFIILMKLIVQIIEILRDINPPANLSQILILQAQILWIFFMVFNLIVGAYTIFRHTEGKKS